MVKKAKSPKFSMSGWDLKEWFMGNWKSIKELLKVGIPLAIGWATVSHPGLVGLITIGGKLLLDTGEYYIKQY